MKKLLSVALVLALLMTCAAAFADVDGVERFGKYDELTHITLLSTDRAAAGTSSYDSSNPSRFSPAQNEWINGYAEYLNIELERIIAEDNEALNARLTTGLASGDLPDLMIVGKQMFYVLAENGVLKDLSDVYENYEHKVYLDQIQESYPTILESGMYEGELLAYPSAGNCYNGTSVVYVRQDWLDQVGKSVPVTLDDFEDVALAFKDAKLGGDDTMGFAMYPAGTFVMEAYGVLPTVWMEQDDGSYVYGYTHENMKEALLKLQDWYKKGIIKSDFAVAGTTDEDISTGRAGMFVGEPWRAVTSMQTNINNDENADWVVAPIPTIDGERVKQRTNAAVNTYLCVNAECEHPEALFMLIEFDNEMRFSADPAISARFNVCEDGYQMWNLSAMRDIIRANADLYKGILIADGLANDTPEEEMDPFALSNYQLCRKAVEGDRAYLGRLIAFVDGYKIVQALLDNGYLYADYNGPLTETMTTYQSTINEALNSAVIKVIMGEDISVYEKAVQEWYAAGGQTITDEVTAYYKSMK